MIWTPEKLLTTFVRRSIYRGHVSNAVLVEDGGVAPTAVEPGEQAIAIVYTTDFRRLVFTSHRVIEDDSTLFRYADLIRCHHITEDSDLSEKGRLKRSYYDRLIFELVGEKRIVIEKLGQSVWPLLKFFTELLP